MEGLVGMFKALSEVTRLRIVFCLMQAERELCICELMDALSLAQYNISRHMKELRTAGLVQERREGKFVFYSLRKPSGQAHALLLKALDSFDKRGLEDDNRRLKKRLALRQAGKCVVGIKQGCCG